ncbi:pyrroline-5-carboxylate reductase family protein [Primorskyibacter sp. 2E233]|uniref:pyrroline-5-carboxylate reductase family protein n=1 Tax=Primorskyibacter sp. 2E233 TaxID=3413431 RepID=UPI003BF28147
MPAETMIGLIGTGMLGRAILRGWLDSGIDPARLLVCNRSGSRDGVPKAVALTTEPSTLAQRCDAILLCVPPASVPDLALHAPDKLILSVMAGATRDQLSDLTGSPRVIRAMSSPAAGRRLAYSPWIASPDTTPEDRAIAKALFEAIGKTDEVSDEAHIDLFTAMTGPVPGFAAYFAALMARHATAQGVAPEIADRAVRQLFLASGEMLANDPMTPEQHVRQMIDYAGTTAAGLLAMETSPIQQAVAEGLQAAADKARTIV